MSVRKCVSVCVSRLRRVCSGSSSYPLPLPPLNTTYCATHARVTGARPRASENKYLSVVRGLSAKTNTFGSEPNMAEAAKAAATEEEEAAATGEGEDKDRDAGGGNVDKTVAPARAKICPKSVGVGAAAAAPPPWACEW